MQACVVVLLRWRIGWFWSQISDWRVEGKSEGRLMWSLHPPSLNLSRYGINRCVSIATSSVPASAPLLLHIPFIMMLHKSHSTRSGTWQHVRAEDENDTNSTITKQPDVKHMFVGCKIFHACFLPDSTLSVMKTVLLEKIQERRQPRPCPCRQQLTLHSHKQQVRMVWGL